MEARPLMFIVAAILVLGILPGIGQAGEPETVYIEEGGYYSSGPYWAYETGDLWVNMTVESGGNVDVYLMSYSQYDNAYPYDGRPPHGISYYTCSEEDVRQASLYHHVEVDMDSSDWGEGEIWVVIDNRNTSSTPNDASPTGNVQVTLEVDWVTDEPGFDDFLWLEGAFCLIGFLPVVIIIILLLLIYMKIKKKETPPPPYYPPQPPQYPMPQQQYQPMAPPAEPPNEQPVNNQEKIEP